MSTKNHSSTPVNYKAKFDHYKAKSDYYLQQGRKLLKDHKKLRETFKVVQSKNRQLESSNAALQADIEKLNEGHDDRALVDGAIITYQASIIKDLSSKVEDLKLEMSKAEGWAVVDGEMIDGLEEDQVASSYEIAELRRRVEELEDENEYLADNALAEGLYCDELYRRNRRKTRRTNEKGPWKMLK